MTITLKKITDKKTEYVELKDYLVEPGDSIHIEISEREGNTLLVFSGRGADKFECRWKIDQTGITKKWTYVRKEMNKHHSIVNQFNRRVEIADSVIAVQVSELNKYRKVLTPEVYKILKADIIGNNNKQLKIRFWDSKNMITTAEKLELSQRMIAESQKVDLEENIMAMSPFYIRYLSDITIVKLMLENPGVEDYELIHVRLRKFEDLCSKLRNDYTGILREKLLLYNLQSLHVQDTYGIDECLRKSLELIRTPSLKRIANDWFGKKIRGADAFNFALPDTTGHIVQLEDFRGKVVYLDIWFTGCGGCANLAAQVDKMVYPKFKENPDVVFVSVSFDKNRETWLKSVREEKYGLKEYINLYTDGLGLDHPFMKYYEVQGGPTTMLIDRRGKIYSSAPPKHGHTSELIALINEALEE
ncbi:TlpA family protein disulfide reductase [Sinomicrobium oceani]|uniref:TlpA family protein disulfide reductase n=1 Tax=Sinomicrobium oceani TaxID=1150368 RepID=UPI00227B37F2|nr:TlpA disulfide reductase family protein [Sinomicrobium oceani]